ncbi:hypothetical protein BGZ60DRAFT_532056 [Tricladium varicosporioides]|nr:hypothetical protein BGZ60DRAFT_532056 [Hymenoscyphus varicosporioides]
MTGSTTNSIQQTRLEELHNNIVTSWLPLTTPAPSPLPSGCASAFRLELLPGTTSNASTTNIIAYDPWYGQAIDTSMRSCLAWEQTQWWAQEKSSTVINLGPFACPAPYTTATQSILNAQTTLVGCCPSDYAFQGSILPPLSGRQCLSPLTSGQVITAKMGSLGNWTSTIATITETDLGIWGNQLNGYMLNDISTLITSASSMISATAPGTRSSPSNTATEGPRATLTSVLGTQTSKAAIGVAIALGGLTIICLVAILLVLRRRAVRALEVLPGDSTSSATNEGVQGLEEVRRQELSGVREYCEMPNKEISDVEENQENRKDAIEMCA